MRNQRVHVNLESTGARRQAEGTAGRRRELAGQRHVHQIASGTHKDAGNATRVEGGNIRRISCRRRHRSTLVGGYVIHPRACHLDAHTKIGGDAANVFESISPVVGTRRGQDARSFCRAGENTTDVPRLGGNACLERCEHLVGGALLRPGKQRRNGSVGSGNLGDFEDSDVRIGA